MKVIAEATLFEKNLTVFEYWEVDAIFQKIQREMDQMCKENPGSTLTRVYSPWAFESVWRLWAE